jgi:hypothetical protein
MAIIISADELKRTIPGYAPERSHLVHAQSAKMADALYAKTIRESDLGTVVLLSGGTASGKTEFMSEYLVDEPCIILDGTLPSLEGARIKTRNAHKYGKRVSIVAVWPADLKVAFAAFLQRDRKFPDEHFYRTHSQSRRTLLEIEQSDLDIDIKLYENKFEDNELTFYEYTFDSQEQLIEKLEQNQYTEQQIIDLITQP